MKMNDLKLLPPPEKKIVAKTLYQMGWGSRKLEQWLGLSDNTILRSINEPTPEELKRFEADFISVIQSEKQRGIALGLKRLIELIPKERRVDQVVRGLEYLEGKNQPNVAVQVNQFSGIEFTQDESENKTAQHAVSDSARPAPIQDSVRREEMGEIHFEPTDNAQMGV